jgi:hypothetical protein
MEHSLISLVQSTEHLHNLLPATNNVVGLFEQLVENLRLIQLLQKLALKVLFGVVDQGQRDGLVEIGQSTAMKVIKR